MQERAQPTNRALKHIRHAASAWFDIEPLAGTDAAAIEQADSRHRDVMNNLVNYGETGCAAISASRTETTRATSHPSWYAATMT
jgi:hypothetical protein